MWGNQNLSNEEQNNKVVIGLINTIRQLVKRFQPQHQYNDRIWKFHLKIGSKWVFFIARLDRELFIISSSKCKPLVFNIEKNQIQECDRFDNFEKLLPPIIEGIRKCYPEIKNDPIKYQNTFSKIYPPEFKEGVIHRSFLKTLIPSWMRYDKDLGKEDLQRSIEMLGSYSYSAPIKKMTAEIYFNYCKLAYLANNGTKRPFGDTFSVDPKESGREMFRRWADGRDGGLKEIDQKSEEAFKNWYKNKYMGISGDHPWEIYRGGNTTHIDLRVQEYVQDSWQVTLSAYSSTRLAETCRIGLAFTKAGLPFEFNHRESYLKRLLFDDFVGIVPEYDPLHRGWQRFPQEFKVADCIHFNWLKDDKTNKWLRPKKTLSSLVYWLPDEPMRIK